MKAALVERFGGPEVLRPAEVPRPEPGEGEVLVELQAAGVNRADVLTRSGGYHAAGQPPIVPGLEGSGVVREVGASVTGVGPGDRVLAFGGRPGFYAEYVAVPEGHVVRVPEGLSPDAAATLPVAPSRRFTACDAWRALGRARRCSCGRRPAGWGTWRCSSRRPRGRP